MKRSIEAMLDFLSPVSLIPGIGGKRIEALRVAGVETVGDLLYRFPIRYVDRSKIIPLIEIGNFVDQICTVRGIVDRVRIEPGRRSRLRARISDESGSLELLWFQGVQYFKTVLKPGEFIVATGKVAKYGHLQMAHPAVEILKEKQQCIDPFQSVYSLCAEMRDAGIQQKLLNKSIMWLFSKLQHYPKVLPNLLEKRYNFPPLQECLLKIHRPEDLESLPLYKQRIKYEEMYKVAVILHWNKKKFQLPGRSMAPGVLFSRFKSLLTFDLTSDQLAVINCLFEDAKSSNRMHRLLQGDVGSGKTVVAFMSCLPALNSGFQVAWLVPTAILAEQAGALLGKWLKSLGFEYATLNGAASAGEKKRITEGLGGGQIQFVIGTHALLQPGIKFKVLGMIVIDEQHKFGVEQRRTLLDKDPAADFLIMSATPIPQTLVQTVYGELDLVEIRKGPQGRIPVSTHCVPDQKRHDMEQFVLQRIEQGEKIFYIVPRIDSGEDEDVRDNFFDVECVFKRLSSGVFSGTSISYIHGKMSDSEKKEVMERFACSDLSLLVATSIVEVGIDVPQATVIIIENADWFGLAQLHQLRGRVGRGSKKSWCFLLSNAIPDSEASLRLQQFCKNHDGFAIAEMDLKLRGPGQVMGTQQSGWCDIVMDSIVDNPLQFKEIQQYIENLQVAAVESNT
jgi:ATP-dependent DNA helicase RecG